MAQESPTASELPRGILVFPGVRRPAATATPRQFNGLQVRADENGWAELRERLLDRWPALTAEELEATHGRPELVDALIEAKLRYGRRLADEAFRPWRLQVTRPQRRSGSRALLGVLGLMSVSGLAFFGLLHP